MDNPKRTVARPNPAAFTLIEVLVVVAIMALLVSILIPALGKAREQTRTSTCLSGLKQLGSAVSMYTIEAGSTLPGPIFPGVYRYTDDWMQLDLAARAANQDANWYRSMLPGLVRRYLQANRAQIVDATGTCPTQERLLPLKSFDTSTTAFPQRRPMMYMVNTFETLDNTSGPNVKNVRNYPSVGTDPAYYFGRMNSGDSYVTGAYPQSNSRYRPKKIDRVAQASREWMMADAWWWQIASPNGTRVAGTWFQIFPQIFSMSSVYDKGLKKWYVLNYPFHNASTQYSFWEEGGNNPVDRWDARRLQDGKTNSVFFDGHAESVRGWKGTVNPCYTDRGC